ncbi:hypothetical protein DL546_001085 [Coniochaeta pulveracea]|uniref:26S proteasome complex subunit SEM1 n=1 Tax=Coniochaeta pulveracea TaxID=177199 RepID=A0A420YLI2_9PEZI|nr:hypothetical protein DL546_001085 [Coniochaeta pulveracea]
MASSSAQSKPDSKATDNKAEQTQATQQKPAAADMDHDEFEDFKVEDWPEEETEAAQNGGETRHLWEESWDDDDTTEDFSAQLREELKKVNESKRR